MRPTPPGTWSPTWSGCAAHLGIEQWLVYGGSWGSTLGLAYAQQHPRRVSRDRHRRGDDHDARRSTGSTGASAASFPSEWERFLDGVPDAANGDLVAPTRGLWRRPDPRCQTRPRRLGDLGRRGAIRETNGAPGATVPAPGGPAGLRPNLRDYFSHGAWLEEGALLRDAGRLSGIPGVLVHGRLDLGGPLQTAWELHHAWPDAELIVVEGVGHLGTAETREHVLRALDRFAR